MSQFIMVLIWVTVLAVLSDALPIYHIEYQNGRVCRRINLPFALIAFMPVVLLASMGPAISDTPVYLSSFQSLPNNLQELAGYFDEDATGRGFTVFGVLIKSIWGDNVRVYRLALALVHSLPIILIFRKYSDDYLMSLFLFVASGCHIGYMMNGIRQFMACTIIFAATPLIFRRKYLPLILVILLAVTIHTSALIMLPVIFIVTGKAWNRRTILYILSIIILMGVLSRNIGFMDFLLQGTEYEGVVEFWQSMGDDGTNPIRVLINALPMVIAFVGRDYIEEDDDPVINVCTNMSVITTGLYLVSMITSGIMLGRLPTYTVMYNYILLPYLINIMFTKNTSKLINKIMVLCYLTYYWMQYNGL